jgi:hypothetical protein
MKKRRNNDSMAQLSLALSSAELVFAAKGRKHAERISWSKASEGSGLLGLLWSMSLLMIIWVREESDSVVRRSRACMCSTAVNWSNGRAVMVVVRRSKRSKSERKPLLGVSRQTSII